jgi:serine/threonine protein kinase
VIGRSLGHYEILECIGEGGMGVVWKARDTRLGRFVALKVLPPEKVADPDRKRRFVSEARSASALNHPNIVVIHDFGEDEGVDFIVLEYVAGRTLDQMIPAGARRRRPSTGCWARPTIGRNRFSTTRDTASRATS